MALNWKRFLPETIFFKSIFFSEQKLSIWLKKGSKCKFLKNLSSNKSKLNILVAEPEAGMNLLIKIA